MLLTSACSDYTITEIKDENPPSSPDDTGYEPPWPTDTGLPGDVEWECEWMTEYGEHDAMCFGLRWDTRSDYLEDEDGYEWKASIDWVVIQGENGSEDPGLKAVYFWKDGLTGEYWTDALYSNVEGWGDWEAWASGPDLNLGDINSCDEDWIPVVSIDDPARVQADTCDAYEDLSVCYLIKPTNAFRRPADDSTCAAGSGSFQLHPIRFYDNDEDGDYSMFFQAVQVAGTGALTDAAWIREVTATETQGATLRVIRVNKGHRFLPSDLLANYQDVSIPISPNGTAIASGVVSGAAPFVAEEVDGSEDGEFTVDMQWECGTVGEYEWKTPPLGYAVTSDDLDDCTFDFPQKFVIRPRFVSGEPVALKVSLYGQLNALIWVPVEQSGNDWVWDYTFLDFHAGGTLDSWDSSDMVLTIDDLSWDTVDLCDAGTYTLLASE